MRSRSRLVLGQFGAIVRRRVWFGFLLALGITAFVLGCLGFAALPPEPGVAPGGVLDHGYRSLQLFVLESGAIAGTVPWSLEVARFLAPGVLALTAGSVVLTMLAGLRNTGQVLRTVFWRDHVVVVGLGRKGALLALRLRASGRRVVGVERDEASIGLRRCRDAGVPVVIGEGQDPVVLAQAGIHRAAQLVAFCGQDGVNAEVVAAGRRAARPRLDVLHCVAHVTDPELGLLLQERTLQARASGPLRVTFFSVFETGAWILAGMLAARRLSSPVLVIGRGPMPRSLIRKLLVGGGAPERPVHLVGTGAKAWVDSVAHPALRGHDLGLSPAEVAGWLAGAERDGLHPGDIVVATGEDAGSLALGLEAVRWTRSRGNLVWVQLDESSGLGQWLEVGSGSGAYAGLRGFRLHHEVCRPELLVAGQPEALAIAIHERYVARGIAAGETHADNPSLVSWRRLPSELQESCRRQADDLGRKLEMLGLVLQPVALPPGDPTPLGVDEVEKLAQLEHERFVQERRSAGWKLGARKDVGRRISPHLVPWQELPEDVREIDRDSVRALPALVARAGYRLGRRQPEPAMPSADRV